jgi:electron transport complex protein RnfD
MIKRGTITWHIPTGMLVVLSFLATVFYGFDSDRYASPLFHLFSGAAMLGAFFIATDPVSASTTPRGRVIFGAGIGMLVYIIRTWGGYPDGVAFAVLLMNIAVPVIDHYTPPQVYGHGRQDTGGSE